MTVGVVNPSSETVPNFSPRTDALRDALRGCAPSVARDLCFLERWEADPEPGLAATLRAGQIRRANPTLAAAIRAELAGRSRSRAFGPPGAGS